MAPWLQLTGFPRPGHQTGLRGCQVAQFADAGGLDEHEGDALVAGVWVVHVAGVYTARLEKAIGRLFGARFEGVVSVKFSKRGWVVR